MGVDYRDYRNDGRPGIFITALGGESFPLYRNEGNDLFNMDTYPANIGFSTFKMSGWGAGIVDFNNDGYKDLSAPTPMSVKMPILILSSIICRPTRSSRT
jgi:hypothetical protein